MEYDCTRRDRRKLPLDKKGRDLFRRQDHDRLLRGQAWREGGQGNLDNRRVERDKARYKAGRSGHRLGQGTQRSRRKERQQWNIRDRFLHFGDLCGLGLGNHCSHKRLGHGNPGCHRRPVPLDEESRDLLGWEKHDRLLRHKTGHQRHQRRGRDNRLDLRHLRIIHKRDHRTDLGLEHDHSGRCGWELPVDEARCIVFGRQIHHRLHRGVAGKDRKQGRQRRTRNRRQERNERHQRVLVCPLQCQFQRFLDDSRAYIHDKIYRALQRHVLHVSCLHGFHVGKVFPHNRHLLRPQADRGGY